MVDKDKDGISDNIDIDGGNGTNKAVSSADAQEQARLAALLDSFNLSGYMGNTSGPTSTNQSNVQTSVTKLTYNSAKAMLQDAMKEADFVGQLTSADITKFMKQFDEEQSKQIEKIVTSSRSKIVPGATEDAEKKILESTARQEFPSFFKPLDIAKNFIYAKINFGNSATLGAKSLNALSQVRGIAEKFQLFGVSDAEMRVVAKQIAMGNKTIEDYTVELQQEAKKEYPQFADRFSKDPTLTTYDIASPVIKMLASTWEKDIKEIKMNNPLVISYLNYAGPDGKGKQPSYYDLLLKAKNDPQYQLTKEANENARDAGVGLLRAMGAGL